jgi:hypothetical protein
MEQIIRSRVIPFPNGTSVRAVEDPNNPKTGFYLITVPRSPLAPHAVRSVGSSRPRYSYAHRGGITTRWLEETEMASAYRDRFALARDPLGSYARYLIMLKNLRSHIAEPK